MPISLSSILFENDSVTNAQDNNQSSSTGQAGMPSREEIRALADKSLDAKSRPITPSDIDQNVDTIIAVATGEEYSDDPEDLEFDSQNGNAVTTKQQSPELPDLSSLLDTETEVESLNENEGEMTIDDEVEKLLQRYNNDILQDELFDDIFGGADRVFQFMSKKGKFFRVKVIKDPTKDLSDAHEVDALAAKVKNKQQNISEKYKVRIIGKGENDSGSNTFDTWIIIDNINDRRIAVVFANGGNKGNQFEQEAFNEIFNKNGPVWDTLMCFLVANKKIKTTSDLVKVTNPGGGKVKRPFTSTMNDVGEIISDVTIERPQGQTPIYISLKNELGKTFANPGYGYVFSINKDEKAGLYKVTSSSGNKKANPHIDKFLEIIGAGKDKMALGYEAYANAFAFRKGFISRKPVLLPQEIVKIDENQGKAALDFLSYQLGFGYIYFRRMPGGGYRIIDLDTPAKTKQIFGDFISGFMKYPYYKDGNKQNASRQFTVSIQTTTALYYVEVRNTSALTRPEGVVSGLQCNVKVENTYAEPYKCQIDWKKQLKLNDKKQLKLNELKLHTMDESFKLSSFLFRNKRNKF